MNWLTRWLCSHGMHWVIITKVLCGDEGPDYAIHRVACHWCKITGFRYRYNKTYIEWD